MPLLDHFHPPIFPVRAWESLHSRWVNSIADQLNQSLPRRFFAEVHQIDVWPVVLSLNEAFPVLPLALKGSEAVPLDLNSAYDDACRRSRL